MKMSFQGIANHYQAYLYAPAPSFEAPAQGSLHLLFFQSAMTTVTVPANVEARAKVYQQGELRGEASVSGPVTTLVNVVLRIQLVAS
ncbi:MAG: hypothetical protein E6J91_14090 [Deltaproteobacteria bacterium]|nr:MAG: hypothetical protein E6J91_14090 [Deltaproteobacteria bacterium]